MCLPCSPAFIPDYNSIDSKARLVEKLLTYGNQKPSLETPGIGSHNSTSRIMMKG